MGCGISRSPIDRLLLERHNGCLVVLESIATVSLFCDFILHVAFSECGHAGKAESSCGNCGNWDCIS